MSIEHVNAPDGERHEPKGASTATEGSVIFSLGDGTTEFRSIEGTDLPNNGALTITDSLVSENTAAQPIPATGNVITVDYGDQALSASGDIEILADGRAKVNVTGVYYIATELTPYKLPDGVSSVTLESAGFLNGAQATPTRRHHVGGDVEAYNTILIFANYAELTAGDILETRIGWVSKSGSISEAGISGTTAEIPTFSDVAGVRIAISRLGIL